MSDKRYRALVVFLVLVFAISWLLDLTAWILRNQPMAIGLGLLLVMWVPGAAAIFTTRVILHEPVKTLGLHRGTLPSYLAAYTLPIIFVFLSYLLTYKIGWAKADWQLTAISGQPGSKAVFNPVLIRTQLIISSVTWVIIFNSLFTLGEEIGWRGFLYGYLVREGVRWPALKTNFIWGLWHAPLIMMGLNYPGYPLSGVITMIVFSVLLGWVLCWLRNISGSILPPVLAHAALNAQGRGLLPLVYPVQNPLLGGPAGLVGIVLLIFLFLTIFFTKHVIGKRALHTWGGNNEKMR